MESSFYEFSLEMKKDSKILFDNKAFHNSVYLAGYVLEGYIKLILLKFGYEYKNIKKHLNDRELMNLLGNLISIYPNVFEYSILLKTNKKNPKLLLNGGRDDQFEAKWNVSDRYNIKQWSKTDKSKKDNRFYSEKIQMEINNIEKEMLKLKLDGVL